MWKPVLLVAAFVSSALVAVPDAHAAQPRCIRTIEWANKDGDTWRFDRCVDGTMYANRWGGPMGTCHRTYLVGSLHIHPDDDCRYQGPK